jgi:hypothetical protein
VCINYIMHIHIFRGRSVSLVPLCLCILWRSMRTGEETEKGDPVSFKTPVVS